MNKELTNLNPCKGCYLQGLCDHDECGHKLYEIDVNTPTGAPHWKRTAVTLEERKMNSAKFIQMRQKAINKIWTRL